MSHQPKFIDIAGLGRVREDHPGASLIDVRTPAEFAGAHVPGARNHPLGSLNVKALEQAGEISRSTPVYLLCQSGRRAVTAAGAFAAEGFENVFVVEGGTQAWEAAGLQVARTGKKAISIERQVRIAAGSIVLAGVLLGFAVSPWFFGLSGFVGAGLIFAGITDFCGMGLLLARAPWNR